jgi:hypothetical protein
MMQPEVFHRCIVGPEVNVGVCQATIFRSVLSERVYTPRVRDLILQP